MTKYVYFFGDGQAEGDAKQKNLLGGKGANLAEMNLLGIPVPPGFTISTELCTYFYKNNRTYPSELKAQIEENLTKVEKIMGRRFGSSEKTLLVSVRSGARASMPGMMDTILNLGLSEKTIVGIIKESGNERFAYDSYRRFIQMYSDVVLGIPRHKFELQLEALKEQKKVKLDTELSTEDLKKLVLEFKEIVLQENGSPFPEDPWDQLWGAVGAVFKSWMNKRAIEYRRIHGIPEEWGTAVNVQAMVFGNMGDDCATGVAFTRNPSTGEKLFFGEFLVNAQGEDVVAGIRTPQSINLEGKKRNHSPLPSLEEVLPACYQTLVSIYQKLEKHYRDMQDIEFTIERSKVWMLQTRNGKRTSAAAIKMAADMVTEGLIDKKEAVLRIEPEQLDQLLHPTLDPKAKKEIIGKGLPASPGAAVGRIVFSAEDVDLWVKRREKVILVRLETSPEDIHGMNLAEGILTARGGMTSHAAVVARGMGKSCVSGCGDLKINMEKKECSLGGKTLKEGDWITLDGSKGEVIFGKIATLTPTLSGDFGTLMQWVDSFRKLKVRTNADTPHDAKVARQFGAEGIGLCRTEHMFFDAERIEAVREMILAEDVNGRKKALAKILPMQQGDFKGIFREMKDLPVTIRLLDPPLHEFLPHTAEEIAQLSKSMDVSLEKLEAKLESLKEFNPMLGHRGCRLGVTYPEIYEMQVRAIMEAACELAKEENFKIIPEIMIPLVSDYKELVLLRGISEQIATEVMKEKGVHLEYKIGTMIELPRAALTADQVAQAADFFSFGTNDLTQTTYGLSRDDAGKFLPFYIEKKIFSEDPFVVLDQTGVGRLIKMAVDLGRKTKPHLKVGICGEHGGEPKSVEFCHRNDMEYVSCSPFRVPIARLAAAQAALKEAGSTGSSTV
ncbi:MAG: pyruvate, phosphate dikinase [Deltaproteobacteria bacterium]|nr:pyruvate, phosphate dikinase [Deltaproteobacteria bacterium]